MTLLCSLACVADDESAVMPVVSGGSRWMCSGRMAVVAVAREGKLFFLTGRNRERRLPMIPPAAEGHPQWVYWIPKRSFHALHVVSNALESLKVSTLSSLVRLSDGIILEKNRSRGRGREKDETY
jgi:hypothetical protein